MTPKDNSKIKKIDASRIHQKTADALKDPDKKFPSKRNSLMTKNGKNTGKKKTSTKNLKHSKKFQHHLPAKTAKNGLTESIFHLNHT